MSRNLIVHPKERVKAKANVATLEADQVVPAVPTEEAAVAEAPAETRVKGTVPIPLPPERTTLIKMGSANFSFKAIVSLVPSAKMTILLPCLLSPLLLAIRKTRNSRKIRNLLAEAKAAIVAQAAIKRVRRKTNPVPVRPAVALALPGVPGVKVAEVAPLAVASLPKSAKRTNHPNPKREGRGEERNAQSLSQPRLPPIPMVNPTSRFKLILTLLADLSQRTLIRGVPLP